MSRKFDASLSSIVYYYTTMKFADSDVKCKPYSEITVEIGTHLRTGKITLNIFAVYWCIFMTSDDGVKNQKRIVMLSF